MKPNPNFRFAPMLSLCLLLVLVTACKKDPDPVADNSTGGGLVYVGNLDGYLYAVDALTGEKKWEAKPEANNLIYSGPVVANGLVYITLCAGKRRYGVPRRCQRHGAVSVYQ